MSRPAAFVLSVIVCVLAIEGVAVAWQPPVPDAVVDNWRPPANRFAAGNRGVDFAPAPESPVVSAGAGTVSFAGQVGGTLYAVIDHGGGVKTTYGGLSVVDVKVGQSVAMGQPVGKSGLGLHFGVRLAGEYVDPNLLFGRPRLVPLEE